MSEDQNNMRYSQMSEEQAAKYFEQRKQQLMGSLIDQYKSTSSQKKFSSTKVEPQQADSHFVIFNQKRQDSPKQLYGINSNKQKTGKPKKAMPQKKLQFQADEQASIQVKDQGQQQNESEQTIQVEPEPMQQHPSKEQQQQQILPSQQKGIRKVLLSDIGNIDLEIQRLTKEMSNSIIVQENSMRQNSRMESKPYYEMRQRPSSKESKISDASYTKRASCFKGVVRSQSLKKLIQPKQECRPTYNIMQVRSASEKKVDKSIVNKTITIESEQLKAAPKKSQPPQSERKAPAKPVIQMNRSQSKQDTPVHVREKQKEQQNDEQNEQKNSALSRQTPLKSNLKVSFTWKPKLSEANSTKGNQSASYFHNPKDSSSSQQSFFKNKCVEAQIEEAVQLYNNLKSLMNNKTNVLQLRKDANIIPRKTADFFNPKVYDYKQRNGEAIAY